MARIRKNPEDNKLPPRVYKSKYSYYFKPTSKECLSLGKVKEMTIAQVWVKYEALIDSLADVMTFGKLWNKFLASPFYLELGNRTQKDYLQHQKKLLAVFGKVKADSIKPEHIRAYMDKRGLQSKTQANHEKSSMSRVFRWGYERGLVKGNPCQGVSKFSVKVRDFYFTDEEYEAIYKEAPPVLQCAMEIGYLCAARIGDIRKLTWKQAMEKGLFIQQGKTGKKQIKQYTERLNLALEQAKSLGGQNYVICNKYGGQYSYSGFNDIWRKARTAASEKLGYPIKGTFHDLKAKGISDYDGSSKEKQLFSGHKTEAQVITYDRKTKVTPTLDIPVLNVTVSNRKK
ncbi:tyrosine-type recombinase/integrase [Salmonella enterica]|uniref:tyrosine-type recombinase/integrase n=1 Tax=Salmonella enterica TaxID=28901 RepID=UPI0009B11B79|nr:tyrosine-type recombinase/integrase [Salmonella enterica]EBX2183582.1 integrase [Salmonella enterica subsp. enterica serovar Aba]EBY6260756.1 integrase [Salmonella enterica subsp. enterica serovar Warnow]ECB3807388.1 integrase [Salmonella enterica subsp. enterica serovar Fufu]ECF1703306.1 integrase [Salmonella enterica subsp. enterica]EDU3844940.1 tyrosine-type recombinase/integrase [Salmonella enterica subsp. enterica serovar Essen]